MVWPDSIYLGAIFHYYQVENWASLKFNILKLKQHKMEKNGSLMGQVPGVIN